MPFVARLVSYCLFWFFQLRCPFLLLVALPSFCCFSLPVVALSGFSLLLMPTIVEANE